MPVFVFFGSLYRSFISLEQMKKRARLPFVGWCMINTESKNHIPICKIERGIASNTKISTSAGPARIIVYSASIYVFSKWQIS